MTFYSADLDILEDKELILPAMDAVLPSNWYMRKIDQPFLPFHTTEWLDQKAKSLDLVRDAVWEQMEDVDSSVERKL